MLKNREDIVIAGGALPAIWQAGKQSRDCFVAALLAMTIGLISPSYADYPQELRDQIKEIQSRFPKSEALDRNYFHDMGVVARKADDGELSDLTTEIVKSLLISKGEEYAGHEIKRINGMALTDPVKAGMLLEELIRSKVYYEPSEEYLRTVSGQALAAETTRLRANAVKVIASDCRSHEVVEAIKTLFKSGLFITHRSDEILNLSELNQSLGCCLAWKSKLNYRREQKFETDYDGGKVMETTTLALRSNRRNFAAAAWEGEWIYKFEGREGTGEGVSRAILNFRRGEEIASLKISAARLSSVGRMNFPFALAGEDRTVEIEGDALFPVGYFSNDRSVEFTGCRENKIA